MSFLTRPKLIQPLSKYENRKKRDLLPYRWNEYYVWTFELHFSYFMYAWYDITNAINKDNFD